MLWYGHEMSVLGIMFWDNIMGDVNGSIRPTIDYFKWGSTSKKQVIVHDRV